MDKPVVIETQKQLGTVHYLPGVGGGLEMGEMCSKTKSYPPLIKKKIFSTPLT